jgi:hypothetical protein
VVNSERLRWKAATPSKRRQTRHQRRGGSSYGCLFTLLVLAAVVYFGAKVGESYYHFYQYQDVMGAQARFAAHSTDDQIRERLAQLADSLGLPSEASLVTVDRTPHHISIAAEYVETVELPLHVRRLNFSPRAESDY